MPPTRDSRGDVRDGPPGQHRDVEPVRPGRGDGGEPPQRPAGARLDPRRTRVARAGGQRAVEVGDHQERRARGHQAIERGGDRGRRRDGVGRGARRYGETSTPGRMVVSPRAITSGPMRKSAAAPDGDGKGDGETLGLGPGSARPWRTGTPWPTARRSATGWAMPSGTRRRPDRGQEQQRPEDQRSYGDAGHEAEHDGEPWPHGREGSSTSGRRRAAGATATMPLR